MNRKEKRELLKKSQQYGIDREIAKIYAEFVNVENTVNPQEFFEGEKVRLNTKSIRGRKDFERMSSRYKEFVENADDRIFTVHIERETLVSLTEEPTWLFWIGDLIKVTENKNAKV